MWRQKNVLIVAPDSSDVVQDPLMPWSLVQASAVLLLYIRYQLAGAGYPRNELVSVRFIVSEDS